MAMLSNIVSPRVLLIGGGCTAELPAVLAKFSLRRPLLVTDPFMVSSGLIARAVEPLEAAGIPAVLFSETVPEPTDTVVEAGVARLREGDFDCLIGFGGGWPVRTQEAHA